MVLIIDYKAGNIASVSNMISYLGFRSNISSNYKEVELADKIILPGVGSFDFGIESLKNLNLLSTLVKKVFYTTSDNWMKSSFFGRNSFVWKILELRNFNNYGKFFAFFTHLKS